MTNGEKTMGRVAFQGEPGAFSEAAAIQLLGENIVAVPRPTFDSTFRAIDEGVRTRCWHRWRTRWRGR